MLELISITLNFLLNFFSNSLFWNLFRLNKIILFIFFFETLKSNKYFKIDCPKNPEAPIISKVFNLGFL